MSKAYHTVQDFLMDDSFINYCRRSNDKDVQFWTQWLIEHPEQQAVVTAAQESYVTFFGALAESDLTEQLGVFTQSLYAAIHTPEDTPEPKRSGVRLLSLRWKYVAAAGLLIAVIGTFLLLRTKKTTENALAATLKYTTRCGEKETILLPDGTHVKMNAASEISFSSEFGKQDREITFKGEAFFDVAKNKELPFVVHSGTMDIKVLGTSFNVRSYADEGKTETALISGLIEVSLKEQDNRKVMLHPNEKLIWDTHEKIANTRKTADTSLSRRKNADSEVMPALLTPNQDGIIKEVAWTDNTLVFDNDAFSDIGSVLSKWYGIPVRFADEEVRQYHFTGSFKKDNIEKVLDILKLSKKFRYKHEGDTLVIEK